MQEGVELLVAVVDFVAVVGFPIVLGGLAVAMMAIAQAAWMRRSPVPPAARIGTRQMLLGFAVVIAAAVGVLTLA